MSEESLLKIDNKEIFAGFNIEPSTISFYINNESILELKENGNILVKGKLAENDKEVVEGLREWIQKVNNL